MTLTNAPRILVIDDEPQIRRFMRVSLTAEGYQYLEAETAGSGLTSAARHQPDLIILDLGLPDADGFSVLTSLREWSNVPVLVLTARDDEAQKVKLLEGGANDYLTKPFGIRELIARVKVLLRDLVGQMEETPRAILSFTDLSINIPEREVKRGDEVLNLSKKEFLLLVYLARNAGKLITQHQLLKEVWGPTHTEDTHYLRIFISQLRKKLGDDANQPKYIQTEPGVGYRFMLAATERPG